MSRIEGAGRSNAAGDASETVREDARSIDPETERRVAEAVAEQRRNARFGSADGSRPMSRADACMPPSEGKDGAGATAGAARSGAVAPPERKPASTQGLATEVVRLRAEKAMATDPVEVRALTQKIAALSSQWCEAARARGMKPPSESFDPFRASDAELASALLWTEVGNAYPVSALTDGGARFQREIHLALVARSPSLLRDAVARGKGDNELLGAMYKELRRLGDDRPCTSNDTVDSLAARRAEILRQRANADLVEEREDARRQVTIGLDGHVGTAEQVIDYEIEQGIIAANPGSLLGTIGAGISASMGGDIEDMRRAGRAGNAAEGLAGIVKPNVAKRKVLESIQRDVAGRGEVAR